MKQLNLLVFLFIGYSSLLSISAYAQQCYVQSAVVNKDEIDIENYLDHEVAICIKNLPDNSLMELEHKVDQYSATIKQYRAINKENKSEVLTRQIQQILNKKINHAQDDFNKASSEYDKQMNKFTEAENSLTEAESNLENTKKEANTNPRQEQDKNRIESDLAKYTKEVENATTQKNKIQAELQIAKEDFNKKNQYLSNLQSLLENL